ncbi:MAG: M48 family metalloprotease [Planctomycetes bacterium]|nr:M48 family metalloprotease [Planctomycetota bacterium]
MRRLACIGVALAVIAAGCERPRSSERGCPLTPEQEIDVGRATAPLLEARFGGRLDLPAIQAYVRTVGERIGRAASGGQWPYRVTVLDSPQVGSFSLPGGPVFVTRGLVARLRTEGELAAVIAHQVAHAGADHDMQRLCDAFGTQILTDAAEAAARATARDDAGASPPQAAALEKLVVACVQVPYTPEMELEADALGLDYMIAAGYHPGEMIRAASLFESMQGPEGSGFLGLHPNPGARAESVAAAAGRKYPGRDGRVGRDEYQREVLDRLKK